MSYIRGSNPIWSLVDLTGHQFDDTFYMFVLQNTLPYLDAPTWQDPNGSVNWSNPIQFLANGTLPTNIYFDSNTVYRLEFRQGNSQSDPLIYLIENYVPGSSGGITPIDNSTTTDNQITNPQFALINFVNPLVLTSISTQSINVAPGWFLDLTGSGNATITQIALNNSGANPTNAPYALRIQLSGSWSAAILRQRFFQNGMLWANSFVASSITALSNNAPQSISAQLVDSASNILGIVLESTPLNGTFNEYTDNAQLGPTLNTATPPAAYIDYQLLLPFPNSDITVTSVQLISSASDVEPIYEQTSIPRQISLVYHDDRNNLFFKPIPSYLIGWDFPLNPFQYGTTVNPQGLGVNSSYYGADQTILFQSVNNGITMTQPSTGVGNLVLTAAATTQMAIIQYLSAPEMEEILNAAAVFKLSSMARVGSTVAQNLTISLWWTDDSSVVFSSDQSFVKGLDANGHPNSVGGNWKEITRGSLGSAQFTTSTGLTMANYGFNNFSDSSAYLTGKYFAIVVGTNTIVSGNAVVFESVSLVPGQIPTIPAPMSASQVLSQCQYYYELTGTSGTANAIFSPLSPITLSTVLGGLANAYAQPFSFTFNTTKRVIPGVTFYSIAGSGSNVSAYIFYNVSNVFTIVGPTDKIVSTWWSIVVGTKGVSAQPINLGIVIQGTGTTSTIYGTGGIRYHYVADARLGIV
jgi:hypothetical protein